MTAARRIAIALRAAALCSSLLCGAAWSAVTASADRTQLAPGESIELTLQSDRGGAGQPDLAPLAKDFEILRRSSSNSLQIVNGTASSQRQLKLTLVPRRSGRIEVPRLEWDGEQSATVELIVAAPGAAGAGAQAGSVAHVFFTTTLDSLQPHVQSALSLQLRLYSDKKLYQASVEFPGTSDALVRRVGEDESMQETRNGRTYQVITRNYVLVPQRSGEIQLDGPVLNAQVADGSRSLDPFMAQVFGQLSMEGGMSGTRALRLRGDPVRLVAKARPPGTGSGDWLPAQQFTIDDTWKPTGGVIEVGVPVTRRLRITAVGLTASQLPDLSTRVNWPAGLQAHPDPSALADEMRDGHIVGHRDQDIALLADHPGRFELPALRVAWWDIATHQRREAVLPALTLEAVAGAKGTPAASATAGAAAAVAGSPSASAAAGASSGVSDAASPSATPANAAATVSPSSADGRAVWGSVPPTVWIGVSVGLGLLWLGTLGAWAWTRRRRPRDGSPTAARHTATADLSATAARRGFQRACRDHAARAARDALLAWARATWEAPAPTGLNALARRLGRAEITPLLRELDRACLDGTAWNGQALAGALPSLDGDTGIRKTPPRLPGLYSDQASDS